MGPSPFEGVRVLEFCAHYAGPMAARLLAEQGAQVIKIESATFPDNGRANLVLFNDFSRDKLGASVNLKTPGGQELVRRLVRVSDVILENYAAGVIERLGLDYETARSLRADIIYLHLQGLGHSGPLKDYVTLGPNLMAYTGMTALWGHPQAVAPVGSQTPFPDYVAAAHAAFAILAALLYRAETGQGQEIDLAQSEATASILGPYFLDYFLNRRVPQAQGNASPSHAPHACYPCKGDDRWCVIAVRTEEEWQGLCRAMGDPAWARDPRFADGSQRLQHAAELDEHLVQWTKTLTPHQVMHTLQRAGVPAGAVQSNEDLFYDYHLRERDWMVPLEHPELGALEVAGATVRRTPSPQPRHRPAPALGEHNAYVFGELLGLAPEEVEALTASGVLV